MTIQGDHVRPHACRTLLLEPRAWHNTQPTA